ncbi:MAG: hypothetical protein FJ037_00955 [Chloroflexi bacterium]|nr:hypothetical protein [Chloroflexota bacterium]
MNSLVQWQVAARFGVTAGIAVLLGACSSSGTKLTAGGSPTGTPAAAHSNVAVTLKDFGVTTTPGSVPAGHITFITHNAGATPHELVVVKTDLAPDRLPQVDQKFVDVKQVQVLAETEPFDGGTKPELTAELPPGRYVLLCNVASHYISGMYAAFTVTDAPRP